MKSTSSKPHTVLTERLKVYSLMAGATLSLMSSAQGAVVERVLNPMDLPGFNCADMIQSQEVQGSNLRHKHRTHLRAMSYATCSTTSSSTGGE